MKKRKKTEYDRPAEWMPRTGDTVDYHSIIGEPATSFNHEVMEVWIANTGYPVANITNMRGWVSVDALTPALVLMPITDAEHKKMMSDVDEAMKSSDELAEIVESLKNGDCDIIKVRHSCSGFEIDEDSVEPECKHRSNDDKCHSPNRDLVISIRDIN